MGLTFPNVLGLAAGFDKNAVGIDALGALGFGHVEVGTVTGEPQPGNPKPRLFRLPADRAVVNRMGFNNDGAEAVAARLAARESPLCGRRRSGPRRQHRQDQGRAGGRGACGDYEKSAPGCSRRTPTTWSSTSARPTRPDCATCRPSRSWSRSSACGAAGVAGDVPLLVKIAPDLADDDVLAVADLAAAIGLDGIIATNTTISRDGLASTPEQVEAAGAGGLSGRPLNERSLDVMRLLRDRVGDGLTLIGVGGITTVEDARARLDAGADLLQGYTAFIYEGPGWPRRIAQGSRQ